MRRALFSKIVSYTFVELFVETNPTRFYIPPLVSRGNYRDYVNYDLMYSGIILEVASFPGSSRVRMNCK